MSSLIFDNTGSAVENAVTEYHILQEVGETTPHAIHVIPNEGSFYRKGLKVYASSNDGTETKGALLNPFTDFFFSPFHSTLVDTVGREIFSYIIFAGKPEAIIIEYQAVGGDSEDTILLNQVATLADKMNPLDWKMLRGQENVLTPDQRDVSGRKINFLTEMVNNLVAIKNSIATGVVSDAEYANTVANLQASIGPMLDAVILNKSVSLENSTKLENLLKRKMEDWMYAPVSSEYYTFNENEVYEEFSRGYIFETNNLELDSAVRSTLTIQIVTSDSTEVFDNVYIKSLSIGDTFKFAVDSIYYEKVITDILVVDRTGVLGGYVLIAVEDGFDDVSAQNGLRLVPTENGMVKPTFEDNSVPFYNSVLQQFEPRQLAIDTDAIDAAILLLQEQVAELQASNKLANLQDVRLQVEGYPSGIGPMHHSGVYSNVRYTWYVDGDRLRISKGWPYAGQSSSAYGLIGNQPIQFYFSDGTILNAVLTNLDGAYSQFHFNLTSGMSKFIEIAAVDGFFIINPDLDTEVFIDPSEDDFMLHDGDDFRPEKFTAKVKEVIDSVPFNGMVTDLDDVKLQIDGLSDGDGPYTVSTGEPYFIGQAYVSAGRLTIITGKTTTELGIGLNGSVNVQTEDGEVTTRTIVYLAGGSHVTESEGVAQRIDINFDTGIADLSVEGTRFLFSPIEDTLEYFPPAEDDFLLHDGDHFRTEKFTEKVNELIDAVPFNKLVTDLDDVKLQVDGLSDGDGPYTVSTGEPYFIGQAYPSAGGLLTIITGKDTNELGIGSESDGTINVQTEDGKITNRTISYVTNGTHATESEGDAKRIIINFDTGIADLSVEGTRFILNPIEASSEYFPPSEDDFLLHDGNDFRTEKFTEKVKDVIDAVPFNGEVADLGDVALHTTGIPEGLGVYQFNSTIQDIMPFGEYGLDVLDRLTFNTGGYDLGLAVGDTITIRVHSGLTYEREITYIHTYFSSMYLILDGGHEFITKVAGEYLILNPDLTTETYVDMAEDDFLLHDGVQLRPEKFTEKVKEVIDGANLGTLIDLTDVSRKRTLWEEGSTGFSYVPEPNTSPRYPGNYWFSGDTVFILHGSEADVIRWPDLEDGDIFTFVGQDGVTINKTAVGPYHSTYQTIMSFVEGVDDIIDNPDFAVVDFNVNPALRGTLEPTKDDFLLHNDEDFGVESFPDKVREHSAHKLFLLEDVAKNRTLPESTFGRYTYSLNSITTGHWYVHPEHNQTTFVNIPDPGWVEDQEVVWEMNGELYNYQVQSFWIDAGNYTVIFFNNSRNFNDTHIGQTITYQPDYTNVVDIEPIEGDFIKFNGDEFKPVNFDNEVNDIIDLNPNFVETVDRVSTLETSATKVMSDLNAIENGGDTYARFYKGYSTPTRSSWSIIEEEWFVGSIHELLGNALVIKGLRNQYLPESKYLWDLEVGDTLTYTLDGVEYNEEITNIDNRINTHTHSDTNEIYEFREFRFFVASGFAHIPVDSSSDAPDFLMEMVFPYRSGDITWDTGDIYLNEHRNHDNDNFYVPIWYTSFPPYAHYIHFNGFEFLTDLSVYTTDEAALEAWGLKWGRMVQYEDIEFVLGGIKTKQTIGSIEVVQDNGSLYYPVSIKVTLNEPVSRKRHGTIEYGNIVTKSITPMVQVTKFEDSVLMRTAEDRYTHVDLKEVVDVIVDQRDSSISTIEDVVTFNVENVPFIFGGGYSTDPGTQGFSVIADVDIVDRPHYHVGKTVQFRGTSDSISPDSTYVMSLEVGDPITYTYEGTEYTSTVVSTDIYIGSITSGSSIWYKRIGLANTWSGIPLTNIEISNGDSLSFAHTEGSYTHYYGDINLPYTTVNNVPGWDALQTSNGFVFRIRGSEGFNDFVDEATSLAVIPEFDGMVVGETIEFVVCGIKYSRVISEVILTAPISLFFNTSIEVRFTVDTSIVLDQSGHLTYGNITSVERDPSIVQTDAIGTVLIKTATGYEHISLEDAILTLTQSIVKNTHYLANRGGNLGERGYLYKNCDNTANSNTNAVADIVGTGIGVIDPLPAMVGGKIESIHITAGVGSVDDPTALNPVVAVSVWTVHRFGWTLVNTIEVPVLDPTLVGVSNDLDGKAVDMVAFKEAIDQAIPDNLRWGVTFEPVQLDSGTLNHLNDYQFIIKTTEN